MSNREKLPELIDRYNNGELEGEELTYFLELMKVNSRLRKEVALDSELNEILANKDILELRQIILSVQKKHRQKKRPDLQVILLAASFLLLIATAVFLVMINSGHHLSGNSEVIAKYQQELKQSQNNKVEKEETKMPVTKEINIPGRTIEVNPSASFRTNPSFEKMIGATRHIGYFTMIAPRIDSHFNINEEILFKWTLNEPAKVELMIMDNTGLTIKESESLNNNYSLPPGTLKKGLFYFKVLQKDEIIFFGKFVVE